MNSNKVLRLVKLVIIMLTIVAVIIVINAVIKNSKTSLETADIKSNMLLIQGAGSVLKENSIVKKDDNILIGTKLSEMDNEIVN